MSQLLRCLWIIFLFFVVESVDPTTRFKSPSELGVYDKAAVSTDALTCAAVGRDIMEAGGSAVDAAIAVDLCIGVSNTQSAGIGGGFFMLIYNQKDGTADALISRERAPMMATEDMFVENPEAARRGPLAVAVPGEIKGLWEAHQKYGKLPWKTLFEPSIKLCEEGNNVTEVLALAIRDKEQYIRNDPGLASIYVNPETGRLLNKGDTFFQPLLGQTLRSIAEKGADEFYMGDIAKKLVEDIQEAGGIITEQDLENYEATWVSPEIIHFDNGLDLLTLPPPSSGLVMGFILNILSNYNYTKDSMDEDAVLNLHRIVEAMKFGYAKRTELGDPEFVNVTQLIKELKCNMHAHSTWAEIDDSRTYFRPKHYGAYTDLKTDHGTSHFSLVSPDGDAVAVTSTINLGFGSCLTSKQTGILLNDQMDDFSIPGKENAFGFPPSPSNFIQPNKIPMSSMSPSIFIDEDGQVRMVTGAAGGSKIISGTALVALRSLWFDQDIKTATDARRLHHQLIPMKLEYETRFPKRLLSGLRRKMHKLVLSEDWVIGNVACSIVRHKDGKLYANSDYRKGGTVAGIN